MITPQIVAEHGLSPEEYERIQAAMGREPYLLELGIFSVMWSEHCSYKSSRIHLKKLPTKGRRVLCQPRLCAGEKGHALVGGQRPGGTVRRSAPGKVVYQKAHGVANLETREPMRADSLFRLYSMTKPIASHFRAHPLLIAPAAPIKAV